MAITASHEEMGLINARTAITEAWAEKAYHAANAQYEALWNATAPGGAAQTYLGHDHTPQGGGGPIWRSGLWSENSVDSVLATRTFSLSNTTQSIFASSVRGLGPFHYHPSPGLLASAQLTGWICTYARGSKFSLVVRDEYNREVDYEIPETTEEKIVWTQFALPVRYPGAWRVSDLLIRCGAVDPAVGAIISIYAIQIDETPASLIWRGTRHLPQSKGSSSGTILSSFPRLEDQLVQPDEWLDTFALKDLYRFGNALYEGIEERRAPGATSQICKGHDHAPAGFGGRPIARGRLYTAGYGEQYLYSLAYILPAYVGWKEWDLDDGANRRTLAGIGHARYWVSPGLTSAGSPPANPPYLSAQIYVFWSWGGAGVPTVNIRALHIASGNVSATIATVAAAFSGWMLLDKIPCAGDAINQITLQVEVVGIVGTLDVELHALELYEVPGVGGRTNPLLPVLATGGP